MKTIQIRVPQELADFLPDGCTFELESLQHDIGSALRGRPFRLLIANGDHECSFIGKIVVPDIREEDDG